MFGELLMNRILVLFKTNQARKNNRFTYTYLKDCYHILISVYFSDPAFRYKPKTRVSLDKLGLPRIIPVQLRMLLGDRRVFVFTSTLLSIFRVINFFPKVDLDSIIRPFKGISRTLDRNLLANGLLRLYRVKYGDTVSVLPKQKLRTIRSLSVQTAGPNCSISNSGVLLDACALVKHPFVLLSVYRLYLKLNS
jgi:hypothetical protein